MRKILSLVLTALILLGAGCSGSGPSPNQQETNPIENSQTEKYNGAANQPEIPSQSQDPGSSPGQTAVEQPGPGTPSQPAVISVEDITLNTSDLSLAVKETFQLVAAISPLEASSKKLHWSTSDPAVAAVSDTGLVTAQGNGTAEVKATSADGEVSATASVSVSTPATGLSLTPSSLQLKLGQTKKLTATLSPQSASDKRVTWSSNKPEVVQVDSSGMVTAQGNGTATISVKTVTGKLTASTTITVTTPVSGVTLNKTSLNLKTGQTTQLTASIQPAGASEKGITWSSNKPAVATVSSSGLVTAKGKGTAVITVTTKDGSKTAKATITVTELQQTGTADELLMLSLVNEEREKAGLGPLRFNIKLTEVARIKSQDMIDNKYFAHDSPTYGSPFEMMKQFGITYRYAAENLALHPSVESAHQGLMNSPGHRANILNPNLTEIGIGIIPNSQGRYYVTQMFIGF